MDPIAELKALEAEQKKIEERKAALQARVAALQALDGRVGEFVAASGVSPEDVLQSLARVFKLKVGAPVAAAAAPAKEGKRKRVKMTAELRDGIKADVAAGRSKLGVAKQRGISYPVVDKVLKGAYDAI